MSKLEQKATNRNSEEKILMNGFKFFDMDNSGTVDRNEFHKSIEKLGIMIPSQNVWPLQA